MFDASETTLRRARQLAGQAYARGVEYWRQGRVLEVSAVRNPRAALSPSAASDQWLVGAVQGTERYRVRVRYGAADLHADCTCPVDAAVCKHVVAVLLAHFDQESRVAPAAEPSPELQSGDELERWAAAHQVTYYLDVEAAVLLSSADAGTGALLRQERQLAYLLPQLPLRTIAVARASLISGFHVSPALAVRAQAELRAEAARVATALTEEQDAPPPPSAPAEAELYRLLTAARSSVRQHATPRPRAWRRTQSWELDARTGAARWRERQRWFLSGTPALPRPLDVEVEVAVIGGAPRLRCRCQSDAARCVHALALLDTLLDVLVDPGQRARSAELTAELLRPAWSRALAELAASAAPPTPRRASIEVWWRIEDELGRPILTPLVRKLTKSGALSAGARVPPERLLAEHGEVLEPRDRTIAEHLLAWSARAPSRDGPLYPVRAFAAALGHPRLLAEALGGAPVALLRAPLGFTAVPAGEQLRLEPTFEGARFEPRLLTPLLSAFRRDEPLLTLDPGGEPRYLMIDVGAEARRLWDILCRHGDTFPPESHSPLLEQLAALESRLPLQLPRQLLGTRVDPDERTVLRLRLLPDVVLELELFVRPGPGAPLYVPGAGPRDVLLLRDGERCYVRRDLASEPERATRALAALPLAADEREEGPPGCHRIADPNAALRLIAALDPPPPGLVAEWLGEQPRVGGSLRAKQLRVAIDHQRDWFGITGDVKHETGRLELAVLLDAARRQQRYVRVGEHRWMELGDTLRERLRALDAQSFPRKHGRELSPAAVLAISALQDDGAHLDAAPAWQALQDKLTKATRLRPRPPAALRATLRDYQLDGYVWLSRLAAWGAGACLADDMGLGKTVQAIALLLERKKLGPALVLAPTSVCWNWVAELRRFAPGLRPVMYVEHADRAACLAGLGKGDVLIASYGLLVRDAALLADLAFATLVLDEAQALKNAATQRARAARLLRADFRVALSGTPMENHLGELWGLFSIVFPGLLGSWEHFRDRFATAIERGVDPEPRQALASVLRPFLLRRTKAEVARELPARTEIDVPVALSHEEQTLYEDARLAAIAELTSQGEQVRDQQRRFQVLAALTRLRLLASHPKLYDPTSKIASSKLRRLLELLHELRAEGHRALVFSQFTSHLALVREALDAAGLPALYLDGSTPAARRKQLIGAFQGGEADVFLISLKAGGTGVNLTAADYVIHLDPWWNPAVEDQATDRAHRIGQDKPVTVYRLIARGTIEEKILTMHAGKRALVAGVLDGTSAAAGLSTRELADLITGGAQVMHAD